MTIKQLNKVKTPGFIQQLHSALYPLSFLDNCAKRYGDIFVSKFLDGSSSYVIVSNPSFLQELFNAKNRVLEAPSWTNEIFKSQFGENSLIVQDGIRHQKQRKLLMPPVHGEQMSKIGKLICQITQEVIEKIKPGQTFICRNLTEEITMNIILKVIFGINKGSRYEKIKQLMTTWLSITNSPISSSFLFLPILQKDLGAWSPWGNYIRLRRQIDELLRAEIEQRRQEVDESSLNILSLIMTAKYEDGERMSDAELRDNLLTLLSAGHETTATMLAWALYWIHRQPEVYEKLFNELNSLPRDANPLTIAKLPYLTAVCKETLRIYPVILFTFPRVIVKSVEIQNYKLEPNTFVLPCIYLTHRREDLYPQPEKFDPERFLKRQYSGFEFWPFGGGDRICLGQTLALFEMKLILTTLLLNYKFSLAENSPVQPGRRGFLLGPKGGVKMRMIEKIRINFNLAQI